MPPPPVTPSPHRFVIKKEQPLPTQNQTPRPSTQQRQFNATPRFTFSSTPRPTPSQSLPRATPAASRYVTPGPKTSERVIDAIDISSSDDFPEHVHESIETDQQEPDAGYTSADLENDESIDARSPKRRRVSKYTNIEEVTEDEELPSHKHHDDHEDAEGLGYQLSSSLPILSSPPAPRRPAASTAQRFLLSTPAPPSNPHSTAVTTRTQVFLKPPRFKPPDPTSQTGTQADPLPEQFSPHRKGQKYVPGGLASEMRDLLVNIESTVSAQVQAHREKKKEDQWIIKVLVDEISGHERTGMTLVQGRQVHAMEGMSEMADTIGVMRVVLAGEGSIPGIQRSTRIEVGRTVGIKGPVWEVVIDDEKWGVGVDWKVL